MTTTEAPTCRRCRGSGHEPGHYNAKQRRSLDKLTELGGERAELQHSKAYMRSEGRKRYDRVLAEIRSTIAAADTLGILTADQMAALALTSPAYYKIKNGKTGA